MNEDQPQPEPLGPPEPVTGEELQQTLPPPKQNGLPVLLKIAAAITGASTGAFLLLASSAVHRTAGATRSTHLQWETRQAAIDAAVQAEQTSQPDESPRPSGTTER